MDTLGEWLFGVLFLCSGGNVKVKYQVLTWDDGPSQKNWQGHCQVFVLGVALELCKVVDLKFALSSRRKKQKKLGAA